VVWQNRHSRERSQAISANVNFENFVTILGKSENSCLGHFIRVVTKSVFYDFIRRIFACDRSMILTMKSEYGVREKRRAL